ncbi:MAG: tetratricopeptide repeat protein [Elusimicrobia bacterium]|nr:tetratricopeptide repeat protein [Elusimicrobiota bacterium]
MSGVSGYRRWLKVGWALAYLVFLAAAVEAVVRWSRLDWRNLGPLLYYQGSLPGLHQPSADKELLFEMRPDARAVERELTFTTNRLGLRDPQRSARKPRGVKRIVFLGGSTTFGGAVNDDETYPAKLERLLNRGQGPRVEVWNAGVSAYVLSQEVELAKRIVAAYEPDALVFQYYNSGRRAFLKGVDPSPYFEENPDLYAENLPFLPFGLRCLGPVRRSAFLRASLAALNRTGWFPRNNPRFADERLNMGRFTEFFSRRTVPVLVMPVVKDIGPSFGPKEVPLMRLFSRKNLPPVPYAEYFLVHPPACVHDWYAQVLARELPRLIPEVVGPAVAMAPAQTCRVDLADAAQRRPTHPEPLGFTLGTLEALAHAHPKDAGVWLARADAARLAGDHRLALECLGRALPLRPHDPEFLEKAVEICSGPAGRGEMPAECGEALRQSLRLTKSSPQDPLPWVLAAELAARAGDGALARRSLARARALGGGARLKVRMARRYDDLREPQLASTLWREAAAGLWDAAVALSCAERAQGIGNRRLALRCLERAEQVGRGPGMRLSQDELRRIVAAYRALGESGRALPAQEDLSRSEPERVLFLLDYAEAAAAAGRRDAALERLDRAQRLRPSRDELRRIAAAYRALGEDGRALPLLESLSLLEPEQASSQVEYAVAAAAAGRRDAALERLDRAQRLKPSQDELRRIASAYRTLGERARALAIHEGLVRRRPDQALARVDHAEAAAEAGRREAALASLAKAEGLRPTKEEKHRIARAYQALGESGRGLPLLRALTSEHPLEPALWSDLGVCAHLSGSVPDAITSYRKALDLDPGYLPAAASLGSLLSRLGKRAEALRVYERALGRPSPQRWPDLRARIESELRNLRPFNPTPG